jgi:hypothetical protein
MKTQILFASGIILMALSTSSFAAVDKPMEHNHANCFKAQENFCEANSDSFTKT